MASPKSFFFVFLASVCLTLCSAHRVILHSWAAQISEDASQNKQQHLTTQLSDNGVSQAGHGAGFGNSGSGGNRVGGYGSCADRNCQSPAGWNVGPSIPMVPVIVDGCVTGYIPASSCTGRNDDGPRGGCLGTDCGGVLQGGYGGSPGSGSGSQTGGQAIHTTEKEKQDGEIRSTNPSSKSNAAGNQNDESNRKMSGQETGDRTIRPTEKEKQDGEMRSTNPSAKSTAGEIQNNESTRKMPGQETGDRTVSPKEKERQDIEPKSTSPLSKSSAGQIQYGEGKSSNTKAAQDDKKPRSSEEYAGGDKQSEESAKKRAGHSQPMYDSKVNEPIPPDMSNDQTVN